MIHQAQRRSVWLRIEQRFNPDRLMACIGTKGSFHAANAVILHV